MRRGRSPKAESRDIPDTDGAELNVRNGVKTDPGQLELRPASYRPDIDGLRAIAVIAVVIYHKNKAWLPGGFVGVDVFFAISGYVVAGSLLGHSSDSAPGYLVDFFLRRAKRLVPALVAVVCITGLWMAVSIPPWVPQLMSFYQTGTFALLGMTNNYFALQHRGYFDQPADSEQNPFLHTWSLGVEEQFYFVFPLMVLLAYGGEVVHSLGGRSPSTPRVVLGIGFMASAVASAWFSARAPNFAFYILPSRFWELAAGALCFEVSRGGACKAYLLRCPLATHTLEVFAVAFIGLALAPPPPHKFGFPFPWALLPVLGTLSFITAGASPDSVINKYVANPGLVYIGKLSYSIYLWHWPVFVMFHWTVGRKTVHSELLACLVLAALSAFTYHVIENPVRRWQPTHVSRIIGMNLAMLCVSQLWLYLLSGPFFGKLCRQVRIVEIPKASGLMLFNDYPRCADKGKCRRIGSGASLTAGGNVLVGDQVLLQTGDCRCSTSNSTWTQHTAPDVSRESKYVPCFDRKGDNIRQPELNPYWNDVKDLEPDRGPDGQRPAIFLIGDSHSAHLFTMFTSQCSLFAQYSLKRYTNRGISQDTAKFLESRLKPRDVIILSYVFEKYLKEDFTIAFKSVVRSLQAAAVAKHAVVVLGSDVPRKTDYHGKEVASDHKDGPTARGPSCVPTTAVPNVDSKCFMSKTEVEREFAPLYQVWADLANSTGTFFFDYYQLFCTGETCSAMIPGTNALAYADSNHLTPAGSYYLWPYMCTAVSFSLRAVPSSP